MMRMDRDWRERLWAELSRPWDLIIVGGGIMGAGILREACRSDIRVLLLEQGDFASGTSSRSSKLVHGGLRYLKTGQWHLTLESVRERESLLREGAGLVEPLGFVLTVYDGQRPAGWMLRAGLYAYDLMARRRQHRALDMNELRLAAPHVREAGLRGGFLYPDAQTDDARLTLRVIQESLGASRKAAAINYMRADGLLRENGAVTGVRVLDRISGRTGEVRASAVINASGSWADQLRGELGAARKLRPLRGSHLVFPYHRVPVARAVSLFHPRDRRPVFVFPWEGAVILGTTDLDHAESLDVEPRISEAEVTYLMEALRFQFPSLDVRAEEAVSSYCGVRPVIAGGHADPSKESREFGLWEEDGLLTVTGGKLTTFRVTALQVLREARKRLPALSDLRDDRRILDPLPPPTAPASLDAACVRRLYGRYGAMADRMLRESPADTLTQAGGSVYLWAELRWAAAHEAVMHLQDLMLRRTRIGLVLPKGSIPLLPRVRELCQRELGWDDARWSAEEADYRDVWRRCYSPPGSTGASA